MVPGQEIVEVRRQPVDPSGPVRIQPAGKHLTVPGFGLRTLLERLRRHSQAKLIESRVTDRLFGQARYGVAGRQTERIADPIAQGHGPSRPVQHAPQPAPLSGQRRNQIRKFELVDMFGYFGEGIGQFGVPGLLRFAQNMRLGKGERFLRIPFVHQRKVGRDLRLDGKSAQQRLAEGVYGLDAHPPRRIQDRREQTPGAAAGILVGLPAGQRRQRVSEFFVRQHRPLTELFGDPAGHFRRCRPGERQTQQALRRRPFEQQAQHPVGQHLGLARAGRRRYPDGGVRPGGFSLPDGGEIGRRPLVGDSHDSPPSAADAHSLTRARCS